MHLKSIYKTVPNAEARYHLSEEEQESRKRTVKESYRAFYKEVDQELADVHSAEEHRKLLLDAIRLLEPLINDGIKLLFERLIELASVLEDEELKSDVEAITAQLDGTLTCVENTSFRVGTLITRDLYDRGGPGLPKKKMKKVRRGPEGRGTDEAKN